MPLFLRLDPLPCAVCRVQSLDESSLKINPQAFGTNPYVAIPPIPDISHKLLLSKQSVVEITRFKSTEKCGGELFDIFKNLKCFFINIVIHTINLQL